MSIWIFTIALIQVMPDAVIGSFLWDTVGPQETVTLFWDTESGQMANPPLMTALGPNPLSFTDPLDLHTGSDSCIIVPSTGLYNVYAEVVYELNEFGSRSAFLFADGALIADSGAFVPDPFFQMRVPVFASEVSLSAGECLEVRARAEGHEDLPGLGIHGGVFAVWQSCPIDLDLTLSGIIVVGDETYEACNSIVASKVVVLSGGSLTLKARSTTLQNGFSVEPGGSLSADLVAEKYWLLHEEVKAEWSRELVYLPEGSDAYYNDTKGVYRSTSLPIVSD